MERLKKILVFGIVFSMVFNLAFTKAYAAEGISKEDTSKENAAKKEDMVSEADMNIIINEDFFKPSVKPIIKNGRILVPLRSIFEAMNINVEWNQSERTVVAYKDDTVVQITIDSAVVFRNEEPVELDQPAIIYKDSTYVPLRFIGEAFGGTVEWDSNTRTAIITTNFIIPPKIQEFPNMSILVDKKKVNTFYNPITMDKVGMIPVEPVFKAMGVKTYRDYITGQLVGIKEGIELRINIGDKVATVNGIPIQPQQGKIVDYNETIYVPLKFIEQVFGATVAWNGSTQEVSIFNKEAAFALKFLEKEFIGGGVVPTNAPEPKAEGNTRLMISDNPEALNERTVPYDAATLWQDVVEEDEESINHIVFGYHENKFDEPIIIGITIENLSDTNDIELVTPRGVTKTSSRGWPIYDVGLKIAELSISNQLPIIALDRTAIRSRNSLVIDDFYVSSGSLIGFQYEFKVKKKSGSGKLNYVVRTVVSKVDGLSLTSVKDDPLPIDSDNRHPRGTWTFAKLTTELPVYEAGSGQIAYSVSNGKTDNIFSAETSLGKEYGTISNIGHYGATYKIKVPVVNNTGETKTIRVRLNPRGGRCAAAVKNYDGYFITPETNSEYATTVIEYVLEDGQEEVLEFEMMNAAGSSLPIAINIITVN
ncbi:MAG: hypothetical protein PWP07_1663 [Epulopiscium sp.]|jgi:hypothetical protein|nr:hypothetical protein [Defluviitaleaceae bacterium]MDK2788418.1 hypothetical protein [Candidatus Epulonipiscium sp.]